MSACWGLWVLGGTEKTLAQDLAREVGGSVDENLDIRTDDMLLEVGEHLFEDPDFKQYPLHVGVTAEAGTEAALVRRLVHALSHPPYQALLATKNFNASPAIAKWNASKRSHAAE